MREIQGFEVICKVEEMGLSPLRGYISEKLRVNISVQVGNTGLHLFVLVGFQLFEKLVYLSLLDETA